MGGPTAGSTCWLPLEWLGSKRCGLGAQRELTLVLSPGRGLPGPGHLPLQAPEATVAHTPSKRGGSWHRAGGGGRG